MSASQNVKTFVVQLECKETSIPIEMEVDLANPEGAFEILQMQILSVTEIEACEQEIMSVQGNVIASDADLVAVLRTESDPKDFKFTVKRVDAAKATASAKATAAAPSSEPSFDKSAWLTTSCPDITSACTKAWFGFEPIHQPLYTLLNGKAAVCAACAEMCLQFCPDQPPHTLVHISQAMVCGCGCGVKEVKAPNTKPVLPVVLDMQLAPVVQDPMRFPVAGVEFPSIAPYPNSCLFSDRWHTTTARESALKASADKPEAFGITHEAREALRTKLREAALSRYTVPRSMAHVEDSIKRDVANVRLFEQKEQQDEARKTVPLAQLEQRARNKILALPEEQRNKVSEAEFRDYLIKELLHWFKHEFFVWVNKLPCENCKNPDTVSQGAAPPNGEEAVYRTSRTELFHCRKCNTTTRFPRYNNAAKLLSTRRGRCGEWAQAFTLICRALGFEARYVHDFTDHVWTEVYSYHLDRWVHCDSCENQFDCPFTYESGWGKKLNLIIAFAKDHAMDVTRRYTKTYYGETGDRRGQLGVNETVLQWVLALQSAMAFTREYGKKEQWTAEIYAIQNELRRRQMKEWCEFEALNPHPIWNSRPLPLTGPILFPAGTSANKSFLAPEVASITPATTTTTTTTTTLAAAGDEEKKAAAALFHRDAKPEELQGRQTGSVEWRKMRGELGSEAVLAMEAANMAAATNATNGEQQAQSSNSENATEKDEDKDQDTDQEKEKENDKESES